VELAGDTTPPDASASTTSAPTAAEPARPLAPETGAGTVSSAPSGSPIDDQIDDEDVDLDDLVDVPPDSVKSPIERLAEAFPGSELIDERS
jgi:DNA polymerase-3 subunit gamma/tau